MEASEPQDVTHAQLHREDQVQEPQSTLSRRLHRLRALMASRSVPPRSNSTIDTSRRPRSRGHMPSLLRRLTSRRASRTADSATNSPGELEPSPAEDVTVAPSRRRTRFGHSSRPATPNPRFSFIHQQTVTTVEDRADQELQRTATPQEQGQEQEQEAEESEETQRVETPSSRRRRLSLQMSNFFNHVTTPRSRNGMIFPPEFCDLRPFSPTTIAASRHRRSQVMSTAEPLSDIDLELDLFDVRPPTPAEAQPALQEDAETGNESEYERGFTPTRVGRRIRPQPFVGEPHDEDYLRRRNARRATWGSWGPTAISSVPENRSSDSLGLFPRRRRLDRPSPMSSTSALTQTLSSLSRPHSSNRSHIGSSSSSPSTPPETGQSQRTSTPTSYLERDRSGLRSVPSMFRPAQALRSLARPRRNSMRDEEGPSGGTGGGRIPLAELQRLLASYASRSSADSDYQGHQETNVDGGTITIYGIRRVSARASDDEDGSGLFSALARDGVRQDEEGEGEAEGDVDADAGSGSRTRPRRPRRIFNFIGVNDLYPLPRELEETFDRFRRTRRPRSMFGSGSIRRNGVVEPDVAQPSDGTPSDDSASTNDNDETWIFYIVSAVLPEGHPLLQAPTLFTDNPSYEDMLFLDSFLQKPVANRSDLAGAGGLYQIQSRSNGTLFAAAQDAVDVALSTDRCLICLADFEEAEEARKLVKCEHLFHRECIDTWLTEGRNSCPLCRGEGVEKKNRRSRRDMAGPSTETA